MRTLWNFTKHLHQNPPEPHKVSAPEPSGTSPSIFSAKTLLRNLTRSLHRNPPEPHKVSAPEPSGTSSGSCTRTLRNLTRYLHRNPPEPHEVSAGTSRGICTRTLRNLVRNLVLKLHRIATELIWARDPIYSKVLPLGEKNRRCAKRRTRGRSPVSLSIYEFGRERR